MSRQLINERLGGAVVTTGIREQVADGLQLILRKVRDELSENPELLRQIQTPTGAERVKGIVERIVFEYKDYLSTEERINREGIVQKILDEQVGYGPIQRLLAQEDVTEVMVYGPYKVRYEKDGVLQDAPDIQFRNEEHLLEVIERILRPLNLTVSPSNPEANARLEDGSRVHVLVKPVALDGPYLTIRKFRKALGIEDLTVKYRMLTPELVSYYKMMVQLSKSFVVSGGTGTGKTSHLNAISSFIPRDRDIITIEDTAELQLQQPNVRRIETRQQTADSKLVYEMKDGIISSLRMNPSIIIVGEAREGVALFEALKAMNTGHEGSATTIHANSIRDCFDRMANMIMEKFGNMSERAIIRTIRSAVQWIVQLKRDYRTGKRYVAEVAEIEGVDEHGEIRVRTIFRYNPRTGITEWTGEKSLYLEEAEWAGIEIPAFFAEGK